MSISYEGIGEWCATFVCGAVSEGDIVKVSANGTVGKCTAGDGFCADGGRLGRREQAGREPERQQLSCAECGQRGGQGCHQALRRRRTNGLSV